MMKILIFSFVLSVVCLTSCKDSQYVIKKTDKNLKYRYAMEWYNKKKFSEVIPVLEDLMPYFKGSDTAETLYFMLADCYYYSKENMVAAYHYKTFRDIYPRSYKAEVAAYRIAECYRNDVPRVDLEQTDTEKAIEYYKNFISEYPQSPMVELAEQQIAKLNRNLELKALSAAELYYKTGNYRAAAVTFKNVIAQYPNIKEYEDLMYKVASSYYKFAEKSIVTKQAERYETALNEGNNFINRFPTSSRKQEVSTIIDRSKVKILESAYRNASTYYVIDERPFYYFQSLELFDEFSPEIKTLPNELVGFKNKCYLGILRSHFMILEEIKDATKRKERYQMFMDNYYRFVDKFTKGEELYQAEEMYKKANQFYKS